MAGIVTDINDLDLDGTYTYADYLLWQFEERLELIKGKIFKMSPAPNTSHQLISSKLQGNLFMHLKGKSCYLFSAPFDVRLFNAKKSAFANRDIYTVVQPDLCVVCDKNKLDEKGCLGAPDLVIEILSPGNSKKEVDNKFDLYQESGVREYWIVQPLDQNIFIFALSDSGIFVGLKPATEELHSVIFPELSINLKEIFN